MVQLSYLYITTGKTIVLTIQTFVGKVTSLLFNTLSMLVVAFLSRSKRLLISWLQSPAAVILEPKKIKSLTVFIVSPSICHEVMNNVILSKTVPCPFPCCYRGRGRSQKERWIPSVYDRNETRNWPKSSGISKVTYW